MSPLVLAATKTLGLFFYVMQYINVTIELLKAYSSSKSMKELLAVAIWIKMQHSNSVMWNVTEYKLRKGLHICKPKAERLIQDMKDDALFSVDGNKVVVSSFRDNTIKWTRKGREYRGAMVCKFEVKDYSLKELFNLINEKLFEFQICAALHKDCCMKAPEGEKVGAKGKAITIKQFQKALNTSSSSVSRIKKRLIASGKINSTLAEKHSFDIRNEEETKRTLLRTRKHKADFIVGTIGFVVLACSYSIANREVTDGFRHLIYGKQSEKVIQRDMSIGGIPDGFFC